MGSEVLTTGNMDVVAEDTEYHNYDALYQAACTLPEVIVDFAGQRARVLGGHCASCNAIFVTSVAADTVPKHPSLQLKPNFENVLDESGLPAKKLPVAVSRPPHTLYGFWVYAKIHHSRIHPIHNAESEMACQQELRVVEPDGKAQMSLLEFLQRASVIMGGQSLRARDLRVLWWDEADSEGRYIPRWYQAEIRTFNAEKGSHRIKYKPPETMPKQSEYVFLPLTLHHMGPCVPEALCMAAPFPPRPLSIMELMVRITDGSTSRVADSGTGDASERKIGAAAKRDHDNASMSVVARSKSTEPQTSAGGASGIGRSGSASGGGGFGAAGRVPREIMRLLPIGNTPPEPGPGLPAEAGPGAGVGAGLPQHGASPTSRPGVALELGGLPGVRRQPMAASGSTVVTAASSPPHPARGRGRGRLRGLQVSGGGRGRHAAGRRISSFAMAVTALATDRQGPTPVMMEGGTELCPGGVAGSRGRGRGRSRGPGRGRGRGRAGMPAASGDTTTTEGPKGSDGAPAGAGQGSLAESGKKHLAAVSKPGVAVGVPEMNSHRSSSSYATAESKEGGVVDKDLRAAQPGTSLGPLTGTAAGQPSPLLGEKAAAAAREAALRADELRPLRNVRSPVQLLAKGEITVKKTRYLSELVKQVLRREDAAGPVATAMAGANGRKRAGGKLRADQRDAAGVRVQEERRPGSAPSIAAQPGLKPLRKGPPKGVKQAAQDAADAPAKIPAVALGAENNVTGLTVGPRDGSGAAAQTPGNSGPVVKVTEPNATDGAADGGNVVSRGTPAPKSHRVSRELANLLWGTQTVRQSSSKSRDEAAAVEDAAAAVLEKDARVLAALEMPRGTTSTGEEPLLAEDVQQAAPETQRQVANEALTVVMEGVEAAALPGETEVGVEAAVEEVVGAATEPSAGPGGMGRQQPRQEEPQHLSLQEEQQQQQQAQEVQPSPMQKQKQQSRRPRGRPRSSRPKRGGASGNAGLLKGRSEVAEATRITATNAAAVIGGVTGTVDIAVGANVDASKNSHDPDARKPDDQWPALIMPSQSSRETAGLEGADGPTLPRGACGSGGAENVVNASAAMVMVPQPHMNGNVVTTPPMLTVPHANPMADVHTSVAPAPTDVTPAPLPDTNRDDSTRGSGTLDRAIHSPRATAIAAAAAVATDVPPAIAALRTALAGLAHSASQVQGAVAAAAAAAAATCGAPVPRVIAAAAAGGGGGGGGQPESPAADPRIDTIERALTSEGTPVERLALLGQLMRTVCRAARALAGLQLEEGNVGNMGAVRLSGLRRHAESDVVQRGAADPDPDNGRPDVQVAAMDAPGPGKRRRRQQKQKTDQVEPPTPAHDRAARATGVPPGRGVIAAVDAGTAVAAPPARLGEQEPVGVATALGLGHDRFDGRLSVLRGSGAPAGRQYDRSGMDAPQAPPVSSHTVPAAAMQQSQLQAEPSEEPVHEDGAAGGSGSAAAAGENELRALPASWGRAVHDPTRTDGIGARNCGSSSGQLRSAHTGSPQLALTNPTAIAEPTAFGEQLLAPVPGPTARQLQQVSLQPSVGNKRRLTAASGPVESPASALPPPRTRQQQESEQPPAAGQDLKGPADAAWSQSKRPRQGAALAEVGGAAAHQSVMGRSSLANALGASIAEAATIAVAAAGGSGGVFFGESTSPTALQTLASAAEVVEGLADARYGASPPLPPPTVQPPAVGGGVRRGRRSSSGTVHSGQMLGSADAVALATALVTTPPPPPSDAGTAAQTLAPATWRPGRPPRPRLASNTPTPAGVEGVAMAPSPVNAAPETEYDGHVVSYHRQQQHLQQRQQLDEDVLMQQQQQQQYLQHVQNRQSGQSRQQYLQQEEILLLQQQQPQQQHQVEQPTYMLLQSYSQHPSQRAHPQNSNNNNNQLLLQQQQEQIFLQQQQQLQLQLQLGSGAKGPMGDVTTRRSGTSHTHTEVEMSGSQQQQGQQQPAASQLLPLLTYSESLSRDGPELLMLELQGSQQQSTTRYMCPTTQREYGIVHSAAAAGPNSAVVLTSQHSPAQQASLMQHASTAADLDLGCHWNAAAPEMDAGVAQGQGASLSSRQSPPLREVSLRIRPLQGHGSYGMSKGHRSSLGLSEPSVSAGHLNGGLDLEADAHGLGFGLSLSHGQQSSCGAASLMTTGPTGMDATSYGGLALRHSSTALQHRSSYDNVPQTLYDHSAAATAAGNGIGGGAYPGLHMYGTGVQHGAAAAAAPSSPLRHASSSGGPFVGPMPSQRLLMPPGTQLVLLRAQPQPPPQHAQHASLPQQPQPQPQLQQHYQSRDIFEPRYLAAAIRELGVASGSVGGRGSVTEELLGCVDGADMLAKIGLDPASMSRGQG